MPALKWLMSYLMRNGFLTAFVVFCSAAQLIHAAESKKTNDAPATATTPSKAYKDVNVEQFDKLRANTNNVVLDVRTPDEFASAHIAGATNIDINSPDFEKNRRTR